jgi:hypothetical protein
MDDSQFRSDIEDWILNYLSECTPEHNDLPRCPFAKKSLLARKIVFEAVNDESEAYNMVEEYLQIWNDDKHDAIVIHLDWPISDHNRIRIVEISNSYYGKDNDFIFVEERQTLANGTYDIVIMHRYSEMKVAQRQLKKAGYYPSNFA